MHVHGMILAFDCAFPPCLHSTGTTTPPSSKCSPHRPRRRPPPPCRCWVALSWKDIALSRFLHRSHDTAQGRQDLERILTPLNTWVW